MSIRIDRSAHPRGRRCALLVGCVLVATAASAWVLYGSGRASVSHLLALLTGGAVVAGVQYLWQRAERVMTAATDNTGSLPAARLPDDAATRARIEPASEIELASEFAGVGIWDWDLRTDRLQLDAHSSHALGLAGAPPPALRQLLRDVAAAEDLPGWEQALDQALAGADGLQHTLRLRHADGSIHHCQLRARVFRDHGQAVRLLAIVVDTTQLVQANAVLEQAIEKERALVERLNLAAQVGGLGVWDWNIDADSVLLDPLLARAAGTEHTYVPRGARALFLGFIHPEDSPDFQRHLDAALLQGDLFEQHCRICFAGQLVYAHIKGRIFRDAQRRAVRLLGVTRNITTQVRASEQLEQQAFAEHTVRARLDLATQTAGLSIFDMDGSQWQVDPAQWHFDADQMLHRLFECEPGVTAGELIAKVVPEDLPGILGSITQVMREGSGTETTALRYRVRSSQGIRHFQTNVRTYRNGNGPRRLLGVTRDVTEEVAHALQLQTLLDRFSVVMQAVKISPWEIDPTGRFLWVENRLRYEGLDQMPIAEYSERLNALIPAEDREQTQLAMQQALASGADTFETHFRIVLAGGLVRHMRSYAHIVRGPDGQPLRYVGATTDVTNDVQTTELLQRQAAQERELIDRLNIATQSAGITTWDVDLVTRQFLWIENPIKEMSGFAGDNKSLAAFGTHVYPEDRGKFAELIGQAIVAGRDQISYRYRAYSDQGRLMHLQVHARLLPDAGGRITRALGVTWEVTREVATAEQLEQQAQRLHTAERRLERASLSSSEGHWEADLSGGRMWFSSSFHALLGYDNEALSTDGDALEQLVHPEDAAAIRDSLAAHLSAGTPHVADARLRMHSGEYRWFRQRGAAERDANGELITIAGSLHDIHQQKLAEDALNLAQRRFERAINGTQDGLWELEANGTAWCSPRLAELLGHAPDAFPSDTHFLRMFLHPEDTQAVAAATQAHFQHEHPYDVEIRLRTASGSYRWYRARASAERDVQGRPLRLSGSLQDVTEARAAREALLRATQEAEAASQAKSAFLANVSHEIRTPMNGIIGMTGLLLDTELDRIQLDYAETIRGSADSLLIVINDLLDFSKIEAGKLHIEALEMDLNDTLEEVGSLLALQAAARNLELIVHLHPDVPWCVIGDPQRIRQCLINLIANAIKFTPKGEVVLEISNAGQHDGKMLARFEVRDTGIGIAPQTLKNLFQPFVQADSSTTRHFGGTGLGLSIVRRLVEMMGGSVGVDSVVGTGSRFWFTLPLEPTSLGQQVVDLTRLGKRVLVVDDNATVCSVLTAQLRDAGYETQAAGTGSEAMAHLQRAVSEAQPFDAVLVDHQLPDMDAATLGQQIMRAPRLAEARVVVLTSLDRHGDSARFAKLGFAAYLHKPVRTRELFASLDRVLARQAREWHLQSQPIVTRSSLGSAPTRRCRGHVLLVEDNAVNQKVAVRFLERMGCTVRVADNGAEGVRAYREGRFDIVLMDLQMPVMDGLTATREIRALEDQERPTPIVALTANAMTGQLDRCLQAGMNGFLTKPLEISRLQEILERHGLSAGLDDPEAPHSTLPAPLDSARWHELTAGDQEFAAELASAFVSSGQDMMEEIGAALGCFDRSALARAAHKLKGASANIHAPCLHALAQELEVQSASCDQGRLKDLVHKVRAEFDRTVKFMQQQLTVATLPQAAAGHR